MLWKSVEKPSEATEIMGIAASRLKTSGRSDKVLNEPRGGAHSDPVAMGHSLIKALLDALKQISALSTRDLPETRFARLMAYGRTKEPHLH